MLALEEVDLICINMGAMQGDEQCLKLQGGKLVAPYPGVVQLNVLAEQLALKAF